MEMKQKGFIPILIVLLTALAFGGIYLYKTKLLPSSECIIKEQLSNYAKGLVLVGFDNKIATEEAKRIIHSYGLEIPNSWDSLKVFGVKVPEGKEIEWVCKLRTDSKITSVNLNKLRYTKRGLSSTPSSTPGLVDETASWRAWKPSIGAFTFKLPPGWSVASLDAGSFSEIRTYASNVTWEQAHELERIGDLTLRISLTSEVTKTDRKLTWSSDEVRMKSNTLILTSEEKGPLSFSAEYFVDNPHRKTIEEIIRTFNFQPTLTELDQANNIP